MKTLTKILCTAITVVTAFTLCACGSEKSAKIKVNPDKLSYEVGICQLVQHEALDSATQGFMDALTEELQKAGRTVTFDYQNASGSTEICSTIVNSFVSKDVDLIMANATAALQSAYSATETIPILGTSITEYGVALGLKNYSGTVGGNVSGTSDLADLAEQAKIMVDLLPTTVKKIALVYCSAEANSKYQVDKVKEELEKLGKTATLESFSDSNDLSALMNKVVASYDAVYLPTDNTLASNGRLINNICAPAKIPVFAGEEGLCKTCGFATLSISYYNLGVKTGKMAAEVLLGKKDISTLPIAYDETPVKKYNEMLCDYLEIEIPKDFQAITIEE